MGRPLRLDPEMGIHHIYTRGTKRWTLFHDDVDRRRLIGTLSMICDRYQVTIVAFCLMDNHIHLVVQCPEAGLSEAMRDLKSTYARWFNRRHRSSGPIFEDRFGSKLVTSYRQLRTLIRYVHRNPYAIDPAIDLVAYPWSSHGIYVGQRGSPVWLDKTIALPLFGDDYRSDVETPIVSDSVQNTQAATANWDVPGTSQLAASSSLSDILIAVAQAAGRQIAEVHASRRNGLIAVAVLIAVDDGGFTATEIAEPFGYRTVKAAQNTASRSRLRLTTDTEFRTAVTAARGLLQRAAA